MEPMYNFGPQSAAELGVALLLIIACRWFLLVWSLWV